MVVHDRGVEVDLVPAQPDQLADPQPVDVRGADHGGVAVPVPAKLQGGTGELIDLGRREVLAAALVGVCPPPRWQLGHHDACSSPASGLIRISGSHEQSPPRRRGHLDPPWEAVPK